MVATRHQIYQWLGEAEVQGATHVIILCDTFTYEDYPVFVLPHEDVRVIAEKCEKIDRHGFPIFGNTKRQKVTDVYSLSRDWDSQFNECRPFHLD